MYIWIFLNSRIAYYIHSKCYCFQLKCILEIITCQCKTNHNKTITVPFVFGGFLTDNYKVCSYSAYLYHESFVKYIHISVSFHSVRLWYEWWCIHPLFLTTTPSLPNLTLIARILRFCLPSPPRLESPCSSCWRYSSEQSKANN